MALLVTGHVGLLATFDLSSHPAATLFWFILALAALVPAARGLRSLRRGRALAVLGLAALLRLLLLPLPPTLSDDALRYVWDGKVVASGFDPYRSSPDAAELEALRDESWERLPHRDVATVYPPLAMAVFSIAALSPAPVSALKGMLAAADLGACALLVAIARRRGLPPERVAWYAWNPLATVEIAGMGHVDALGVAAAAAAVLLLVRRPGRPLAAAAAGAAAVLAKLVPVAALPAWARQSGRPLAFGLVALALVAAASVPVLLPGGVPPGLVSYGVSWEFNGPLYEPLWRALDRLGVEEAIASGLDRLKLESGEHDFWNRFYPFNYPRLHARALLGLGLVAALARFAWRRADPIAATGLAFGTVLLFSATVYPWYALWILPWAALCRQPAWLALAALLPLSYLPQHAGVPLLPWVFLAIWGPFFGLLLWRPSWSTA